MSSHREAPEISKDPVADNTDVYAFVSPATPTNVVLIANFIPLQKPDGGPNFYEFSDDVVYSIQVSNTPDAVANLRFEFRFTTRIRNPKTFLYNTGPINNVRGPNWNRPQYYTLTMIRDGRRTVLGRNLTCPPVNVGPRSTPNYEDKLASATYHELEGGGKVFAGQRAEAFHVDLGSIFDLGALRPFQAAHLIPSATAVGVNSTKTYNVHSLVLELPITMVSRHGHRPSNPVDRNSTIGVWASAARQKSTIIDEKTGKRTGSGPFVQVSRLGNPLFNEVIVPMAEKDQWNSLYPKDDAKFAKYVNKPELAGLLPVLYPDVFPNLQAYTAARADLAAILLTGIPQGVVSDDFANFTGTTPADMLRLNLAIPPKTAADQGYSKYGVVGGDVSGFPNGRRVDDDTTAIELRAIAGATIPLVDPNYTPDDAAGALKDDTDKQGDVNQPTPNVFPYLGTPNGGYETSPGTSRTGGFS